MRPKIASFLVISIALAAFATLLWHPVVSSASNSSAAKQPVIVELFTSEGCSDCPPADTLLKKLAEEQPIDGVQIIPLEEHVDYWNSQGWTDPFSSADFSLRQNDYAGSIPKSSVYTPQMIVDGHAQFIGSRGNEALEQIRAAAAQPKARLILTLAPASKPHTYDVELRLDPDSAAPNVSALDFYLAVTEKGLHSIPNAGENSGAALIHAPVVRQLRKLHSVKLPLSAPVTNTINLKDNWNTSNITVVAFLANPKSHQIQAAGASQLP